ncbi:basic proline-rich protein-like [Vidua chalybeata]|uniref:basic proline-rich protein-like n=1 Tax=Vidua chalybeata TaxID=81927 RepID=UPI0023A82733|nr:basic proline-rich protein-like [Vidua chalybeata]
MQPRLPHPPPPPPPFSSGPRRPGGRQRPTAPGSAAPRHGWRRLPPACPRGWIPAGSALGRAGAGGEATGETAGRSARLPGPPASCPPPRRAKGSRCRSAGRHAAARAHATPAGPVLVPPGSALPRAAPGSQASAYKTPCTAGTRPPPAPPPFLPSVRPSFLPSCLAVAVTAERRGRVRNAGHRAPPGCGQGEERAGRPCGPDLAIGPFGRRCRPGPATGEWTQAREGRRERCESPGHPCAEPAGFTHASSAAFPHRRLKKRLSPGGPSQPHRHI